MPDTARRGRRSKPPVGFLAAKIQASRFEHNLSLSAVADLLGVSRGLVGTWERGVRPKPEHIDKLAAIFEWDERMKDAPSAQPEGAPVAVTTGLRKALSTPEDELAYSPRKITNAIAYLASNIPILLERLDKSAREIHRLEQSQGITEEQLAILRDKARRYDQMSELMGRKKL